MDPQSATAARPQPQSQQVQRFPAVGPRNGRAAGVAGLGNRLLATAMPASSRIDAVAPSAEGVEAVGGLVGVGKPASGEGKAAEAAEVAREPRGNGLLSSDSLPGGAIRSGGKADIPPDVRTGFKNAVRHGGKSAALTTQGRVAGGIGPVPILRSYGGGGIDTNSPWLAHGLAPVGSLAPARLRGASAPRRPPNTWQPRPRFGSG